MFFSIPDSAMASSSEVVKVPSIADDVCASSR